MSTTSKVEIVQTVPGGRYVGTDQWIGLSRATDVITDYGDDGPRLRIELSTSSVDLRISEIDELIENLTLARRIISATG